MTQALIRVLWALYPPRFRRRFALELDRDLHLRRGAGRSAVSELFDALLTLLRLWALEARRCLSWSAPLNDVRLALRSALRTPGYSVIVVSILALALGGNAAVFSVTYAVLLKGLPYGAPERVVEVDPAATTLVNDSWYIDPDFAALQQVEVAALYVDNGGANLRGDGATTRVSLAQATPDFFRVLGIEALIGSETLARDERVVVLSHAFWVQSFGADRDVLGRGMELNGKTYRVVGVMPAGVAFPSPVDLWLPFPTDYEFYSSSFGPATIARLADVGDADAVRAVVEDRTRARYAGRPYDPPPVRVTGLRDRLTGDVRTPLVVLLAIAALVVLLGCLNLTGVVLSRNASRIGELSVRRALGAGRVRLFVQVLLEVAVLAALGGIAGLATAVAAAGLLRRMLPGATPGLDDASINLPVLGFVAALTVLAALAVGVLPALQGALVGDRPTRSRGATADRRSKRLQAFLVVVQVALAFVLVAGAALLGRSLGKLQAVPLGYDLEQVLTFQVRLPDAGYADQEARRGYLRDLRAALAGTAGVREVGATTYLPQQTALPSGARVSAPGSDPDDLVFAAWVQVDRNYFRAIGIPVLQGQPFAEPGENRQGLDRLVINAALAQRLFPDGGPVAGRTMTLHGGSTLEARIEAVVGDVSMDGQRSAPRPIIYTDMDLAPAPILGLALRAEGDPARLSEQVRAVAAAVDPAVAPFNMATTASAAARQIAVESAVARLSSIFGLAALILAALGLYGLVSQGIEQRRRELGIRLALGAHPAGLLRRAMAPPLLLTTMGLGAGLTASLAVGGRLAPLLFEVSARDPLLLGGVVVVVIGVATLAALLSGRAALAVDPVESLRSE